MVLVTELLVIDVALGAHNSQCSALPAHYRNGSLC
jgi:hypothetical protein